MKFNFDWNYISAGAPYVTISELSIGFNANSIKLLNNAKEVALGFDEEKKAIGIKNSDDIENAKTYIFYDRMKNGWVRIGCKDFIRYLSAVTGVSFTPAKKYIARYDKEDKLLYILINDEEVIDEEKNE